MAKEAKKPLICITCPVGCSLEVTYDEDNNEVIKVTGNQCTKGIDFAKNELKDPRRMVTTTVKVKNGFHPLAPVYTTAPIPKPLIFELVKQLRKIELEAPVKVGEVVLKNFENTGVDVITAKDIPQAKQEH